MHDRVRRPSPRGASKAAPGATGADDAAARVLALQRTAGNAAVARLVTGSAPALAIQRVTAGKFLAQLPGRSGFRWHGDMQDLVDELADEWGHVEIGALDWSKPVDLFTQFATPIALESRDPNFSGSRYGKLVLYLLTGYGTPPGAGSLGKLKMSGNEVVERPGFATKTLKTVKLDGSGTKARRHITAWHNIRKFVNKLLASNPKLLETAIDEALKEGVADPDILDEAETLLAKKPKSTFGADENLGKKVLKAAFLMNSRIRNLWVGPGAENSEIATFSKNLQTYITAYKVHGDLARLRGHIAGYRTKSALAIGTQEKMVAEIDSWPKLKGSDREKSDVLVGYLTGHLAKLELDDPQTADPEGGALTKDERRIHEAMIGFLFFGVALSDQELGFIVRYFMRGSTTPLTVS